MQNAGVVSSTMMCLHTDRRSSPAKKEKNVGKSAETGNAASWQQVLDYNASRSAKDVTATKSGPVEHTDESKCVISDGKHNDHCFSVEISLPEDNDQSVNDKTGANSCDSHEVEAWTDVSGIDEAVTSRSRSAQDLSTQQDIPAARHRSTDSLLRDSARATLPQVDRVRAQDAAVLSRRRSFSGALHKAAAAVAVRYRGLRDSVKAASADFLASSQDDDLMPKSDKVSLKDLGRNTTAQG